MASICYKAIWRCNCQCLVLLLLVSCSLMLTYLADLWTVRVEFAWRGRHDIHKHRPPHHNVVGDQGSHTPTQPTINSTEKDAGLPKVKENVPSPSNPGGGFRQTKLSEPTTTTLRAKYKLLESIPNVTETNIDCNRMFALDVDEIRKGYTYQLYHPMQMITPTQYILDTKDCAAFRRSRKYVMSPLSEEEAEFSIAYSIVMYRDVEQFERLLRAIYRPQNYYCVHVDLKSNDEIHDSVRAIADCFDNVKVASRSVAVVWGTYSVVEAELVCMQDLWHRAKWRYFINLTGQEFPLKTNWDIVRILKVFNNSNAIEGTRMRYECFEGTIWFNKIIVPCSGYTVVELPMAIIDVELPPPP